MRKSKRNQLTGEEETLGENVPQLLLCCWDLCVVVVGSITVSVEERADDGAQFVMRGGMVVVGICFGVALDGPQVDTWQGRQKGVQAGLCSTLAHLMCLKGASLPKKHHKQVCVRGLHMASVNNFQLCS